MMVPSIDDYMTTREAAERLGVTYSKLMGMIYQRRIRAQKKGWSWVLRVEDVEAARQ